MVKKFQCYSITYLLARTKLKNGSDLTLKMGFDPFWLPLQRDKYENVNIDCLW